MHSAKAALPKDEVEDFERTCYERSRDPKEFSVQVVKRTPLGGGHIERDVTVSCGQIERTYDGSSGTNWTLAFADDLSGQVFGVADT